MSSTTMEETDIPQLLSLLKDPEEDVDIRKGMARKVGKLPSDRLKPALTGMLSILDNLFDRRENNEDLQVLGELLISLGKLSFTFPENDQIKGLMMRILGEIQVEEDKIMVYGLNALKRAVSSHPEMILDFKEKIQYILSLEGKEELKKHALEVIARAAWISPYVVGDFKAEIKNLIKESPPDLRDFTLLTVYRIGRKNYYVLESIIKDLLLEEEGEIGEETLFLLCNINIPSDERKLIEKLFELEEEVVMGSEDPDSRIRAVKGLAHLVKRKELKDLQEDFANTLRLKIEEAVTDEEKKELISTISIPNWANIHILEPLITLTANIITSAVEEKEVKLEAAEVMNANLQLFHEFSDMVVNAYIEVLDTGWGEDIKTRVITLLTSIPILGEEENEKMMESLLNFVKRREEGILARMEAVEALSNLSSRLPRIIERFDEEINETYNSVTFTDLKRTLVEISGDLTEKLEITKESPLLSVLIEALTNEQLYPLSLEYLATITWRDPQPLLPYIEELFEFPENIRKVETQRKDIGSIERISSFERPKRLFIRILSNLIKVKSDITERAVKVFLTFLEGEKSENLTREAIYGLRDAYEIKSDIVEQAISDSDLSEELIRRIKALR